MSEPVIYGCAKTRQVWIGEKELDIKRSLLIENKSPSGYSWGYHGSGPSQLALAIMLEVCVAEQEAVRLFQQFKIDIISNIPSFENLVIPVSTVKMWLDTQKRLSITRPPLVRKTGISVKA